MLKRVLSFVLIAVMCISTPIALHIQEEQMQIGDIMITTM